MKTKIDPYTGEEFVPKRKNQIFANNANKTAFNNEKASKIRKERAPFINDINRNYDILKLILNNEQEKTVNSSTLNDLNFKYNCYLKLLPFEVKKIFIIYDIEFTSYKKENITYTKIYKSCQTNNY